MTRGRVLRLGTRNCRRYTNENVIFYPTIYGAQSDVCSLNFQSISTAACAASLCDRIRVRVSPVPSPIATLSTRHL